MTPSQPPGLISLSRVSNSSNGFWKCSAVSVQVIKSYCFDKTAVSGKKNGSYKEIGNPSYSNMPANAGP